MTRIRTWVTAATTQGPNHKTITAICFMIFNVEIYPKVIMKGVKSKKKSNLKESSQKNRDLTLKKMSVNDSFIYDA